MPRRVAQQDWDDEDREDDDGFDPPDEEWEPDEDAYREDDDETVPCPWCGAVVYEGAERCPHCEKYLSEEDRPAEQKPTWIVATALIVLVFIVIFWVLGGG